MASSDFLLSSLASEEWRLYVLSKAQPWRDAVHAIKKPRRPRWPTSKGSRPHRSTGKAGFSAGRTIGTCPRLRLGVRGGGFVFL